MRVRITYTVYATAEYRRAIRAHYGESGLATREEIREWCETYGHSADGDILHELAQRTQIEEELRDL
jgi:hypothetical protein